MIFNYKTNSIFLLILFNKILISIEDGIQITNWKEEINSLIKINDIHPKDMTKKEWIEDFNSFYEIMNDNYPYFWVTDRLLGYKWIDLKENYLARLE